MPNSNVSFLMTITDDGEEMETRYDTVGTFKEKDGVWYLLFDEVNDEGDVTKCRFEISREAVRVRRKGPMIINQTHELAVVTTGYIKTPFNHVDTRLMTKQLDFINDSEDVFTLLVDYDLFTGESLVGHYKLFIEILTGGKFHDTTN